MTPTEFIFFQKIIDGTQLTTDVVLKTVGGAEMAPSAGLLSQSY